MSIVRNLPLFNLQYILFNCEIYILPPLYQNLHIWYNPLSKYLHIQLLPLAILTLS